VDFAFSAEQELLRASAREFLRDTFPLERIAQLLDGEPGWDPGSWKQIADLGWLDPELDVLDHTVLFEETGHALYPGPFFSSVALVVEPTDLPSTLAWAEPGGPTRLADLAGLSTAADSAGRLTGRKVFVPDATAVRQAYVVANDGVYVVDLAEQPVALGQATVDRSRRLGELRLDATPARRVADLDVLGQVRMRALCAAAAEAVGVGQRALDISAAYASERQQFGRPIGSYQAVSHRIADIYVAVQLARSLTYWAAWCVAGQDAQVATATAAAKSAAGAAAVRACESAIQCVGGIGFTWEHPLHRFYKRAQWLEAFEGGGPTHRRTIAAALLDG
jgi:alkylation response protein AidB-like acyl-CoA dehydrogenase